MLKAIGDLRRYVLEARTCRKQFPGSLGAIGLLRYFQRWRRSLRPGHTPLEDERPWITFAAADYLETVINSESRVFEWGMGGSSLFFSRRAGEVISVEHDPEWFRTIVNVLQQRGLQNWKPALVEPATCPGGGREDPADWDQYRSSDEKYRDCTFHEYVTTIDAYPDNAFDVILIDGRARPSCFRHALPKVKQGGHVVFDNTDQAVYHPAMKKVTENFRMLDFPGPIPYINTFLRTTIWKRLTADKTA